MADTIITNDPDLARAFCQQGPTIFKPLAESALKYDDQSYVVETTLLTDEHKQRLDLIRSQPILLQRYIEKSAELRVTCVGSDILVAKQILRDDRSATHVTDWRSLQGTEESSYTPASLPSAIIPKVKELLAKLDLGFAALDFAVDQEDKVYFLEVNPNGQWLGYTDKIGLPAAQKIARCLVFKTKQPYK